MTTTDNDPNLHAQGEIPCETCGKPHNSYYDPRQPGRAASWADPVDGHTYRPVSWETMYRREVARRAAEATGSAEPS